MKHVRILTTNTNALKKLKKDLNCSTSSEAVNKLLHSMYGKDDNSKLSDFKKLKSAYNRFIENINLIFTDIKKEGNRL